jgi:anti-anti-sigma factor
MSSPSGKVFARRLGDEVTFLVTGNVTCHHSPAMRKFAEESITGGAVKIDVDLRDCAYCDSTFLGTLLQLKRRCDAAAKCALRLVSPSEWFRQMLRQVGGQQLFNVAEESPSSAADTWQQLDANIDRIGLRRFKQNVAEAHRELADSGERLRECFGPVAESMATEIEAEQHQRASPKES